MKRLLRLALGAAALAVLAALGGLLVLRSDWFLEQLRRRAETELEKLTGGRVEIARLRFDAWRRHGRLEGITVHGEEDPGQPPLFRAEAVEVDLRVESFFRRRLDLVRLRLLGPEIHLSVQTNGVTNLPRLRGKARRRWGQELVDLAVDHFEWQRGAFFLNDQRYALDLAILDLRAQAGFREGSYSGRLTAGRTAVPSLPRLPAIESLDARFELFPDRLELGEARLRTPRSEATIRGRLAPLAQPRLEVQYSASLEARELAAALPWGELRDGEIQLQGRGRYDSGPGEWGVEGEIRAARLAVSYPEFRLREASLDGQYQWDRRGLRLTQGRAKLLGGEWRGLVTAQQAGARGPIPISIAGQVAGLRLEALAEALSTDSRRLQRLGWTAAIDGSVSVETAWPPALRDTSAHCDVTLRGPDAGGDGVLTQVRHNRSLTVAARKQPALTEPRASASGPRDELGLTPVKGAVRASYQGRGAEVRLAELRLATRATSLAASGTVPRLDFHLTTERLGEVTAAARVLTGAETDIPVELDGRAVLRGRASGTAEQPQVSATLQVTGFRYEGRPWDSLTGRIVWSPRQLRLLDGRLAKAKAVASLNLTAQLKGGKLMETSPLEAEVSLREVEIQDLAAILGQDLPAKGLLTARLKLQGTQRDPRAAGWIELRRGVLWDEPVDSLQSAVALEAREVRWNNSRALKARGTVSSAGAYHLDRRTFRFDARGENLALASLQSLPGSRKLEGQIGFAFAGSGKLARAGSELEELALEGTARLRGLTVDGRAWGDASLAARSSGEKILAEFESTALGAKVTGHGEVAWRGNRPIQGRVDFQGLDVPAALAMAGVTETTIQGVADGSFSIQGEARRLGSIALDGSLARLELRLPEQAVGRVRELRSAQPVRWRLAGGKLGVESLHLTGEGSDLQAAGTLQLDPPGAIQATLNGSLDLAVLGGFQQTLEISGRSNLSVQISGTMEQPEVRGRLELADASLGSEELPVSLSGAGGVVFFSRRRATLQKLTAEAGGGQVHVTGDVDFAGQPVTYRLRAEAERVRLRHPQGWTSVVDAELAFTGTNQRSLLSGEVRMARGGTRGSVDLAAILAAIKEPPRRPSSNQWLQGMQLNIGIASAVDARFETSLARNLQAEVSLRLRGTALNPALLGRIHIAQGDFQFQGTRYVINRGDIGFSNPFRIDPILNLDLETRVGGYDITLTLSGPLQKLNVSHRSDPPLPIAELITLLAVGRAPSTDPTLAAQQSAQARSLAQSGVSSVIGQALAAPVSGRLQRFFGVSRLKLDPEIGGPEGNPNARITLEQQVGKHITFTYMYSLAAAEEQVIRMQWSINRQWSLIAVRDENGLFGVDFLFKKRYR